MGIRGAGGNGAASIGAYFFMGGLLMLLGAIGEFLLGNTYGIPPHPLTFHINGVYSFPFVVFGSFVSST